MTSTKTFAAASAIAGAVALLATATLPATAQQLPPQGWFKVCSKQEDNDICNTQNIVTADSGQLLTAINLIEIKGKINRKIFQVSVPTGRLIPAGTGGMMSQIRRIATARDDLIIDERRKTSGADAANAMLVDMTNNAAE